MKISCAWLQSFFNDPLPPAHDLAEVLSFHAFEVEGIEEKNGDSVLDVKVLPNRGHDCLSHRGVAKELSAILNIPLAADPLKAEISGFTKSQYVTVSVENPELCPRYIAGYIRGIKVGSSPAWLRERLASIGQKSINNVVDAANFVMFDIGQPLHVFDARKLANRKQKTDNEEFRICVRNARARERIKTLDGKECELTEAMLVIADGNANMPIAIAGIKGGTSAEVDGATVDIILESANFDGVSVRNTANALKLRTDASERFQQVISAELAAFGMRALAALIREVAGGEILGFADTYPQKQNAKTVSVSRKKAELLLGVALTDAEIEDIFRRLDLPFEKEDGTFTVRAPFTRLDLSIEGDLIEEIGRIRGYEDVPSVELPLFSKKPAINGNFFTAEKRREELVAQGYSEVITSVFRDAGELSVLNKVDSARPYLRSELTPALLEAWQRNSFHRDLLGLQEIKIFEIGTVWQGEKEIIVIGTATGKEKPDIREKLLESIGSDTYNDLSVSITKQYRSFSRYPEIVRDVSLWVPRDTESARVEHVIRANAGSLLQRISLFDSFQKDDRTSLAFRLVFQSFEKTLTDEEANAIMETIYAAAKKEAWEVR